MSEKKGNYISNIYRVASRNIIIYLRGGKEMRYFFFSQRIIFLFRVSFFFYFGGNIN